jgi:hypothetical protein
VRHRTVAAAAAATLALALALNACSDRTPTGVSRTDQGALDRSGRPNAPIGTVVTGVQDGATYSLGITVTHLALAPDGTTLLASGVVNGSWTRDGVTHAVTNLPFADVPATLVEGSRKDLALNRVPAGGATTGAAAATPAAPSAQQVGQCQILGLSLGPLHLDLLGLVVDLNQVVLAITAVAGAGNLLGNLLCAITHLLDLPGALTAIINLLDQINQILSGLGTVTG